MNNIDPSGLAVQLGIGIILVLPTAGQVCEAVVAIIGLIVGSTIPVPPKRNCPAERWTCYDRCATDAYRESGDGSQGRCYKSCDKAYAMCVKTGGTP